MNFNERLKKLRLENNFSRSEIANKLNISVSAYTNYENAERVPNMEMLVKISDVLKVSLDFLIKGQYSHIINCCTDTIIRSVPQIDIKKAKNGNYRQNYIRLLAMMLPTDEPEKYFCIETNMEHMINDNIPLNSLILFYDHQPISDGELCLAIIDNKDFILGNVQQENELVLLQPVNREYRSLIFNRRDFNNGRVKICGKAIRIQSDINESSHKLMKSVEFNHTPKEEDELYEMFNDILKD